MHQVTTTTPHGFTAGDAIILDVGSQLNSDWNKLGHQVLMVGSVTHSMAFTVVNYMTCYVVVVGSQRAVACRSVL